MAALIASSFVINYKAEAASANAGGAKIQRGHASWYHHGRRTANGEAFNPNGMTAAHRTLPFGTRVRVVNEKTGRSVVVRINDRGPYSGGRIIDLTRAAAHKLGFVSAGTTQVRLTVLGK